MKGQIFCQRTEYLSKDRFSYMYLSNDRYITFLIKFIGFISIVNKTVNRKLSEPLQISRQVLEHV